MARGVYRYRECPGCHKVMPAGELEIINYHGRHWHNKGGSMRKCPYCGYEGFTQDFKVCLRKVVIALRDKSWDPSITEITLEL